MRSTLADDARRRLMEEVGRMTPEQRLAAFLAHCQLIMELQRSGDRSPLQRDAVAVKHRAD